MKKIVRFAGLATLIAMAVVSIAGCTPKHTHKFSQWQYEDGEHYRVCTVKGCNEKQTAADHMWQWKRSATEHWQVCSAVGCTAEQSRGTHEDSVCDVCAEFRAIAFGFTADGDAAHVDFAKEANEWFPKKGKELGFTYVYASDFSMMTDETLENYDLIVLLNDRPNGETPRTAFKKYMDNGGACVAFHGAGFAQWDSKDPDVPEEEKPFTPPNEWEDWYHNTLIRCGVYGYRPRIGEDAQQGGYYWNTWNPTSELMKIETHDHFATENIDVDEFVSAPSEWYEWHNDLFSDEGTTVLVTMNPTPEDPAGDDNRPNLAHQIWKDGHHAIAWANNNYKMVYMNWGHNLQGYNLGTGSTRSQSSTFESEVQNQFMLDAMFGLTKKDK